MEAWFLYGGMALCLFSLWAIARHDWVRLTRPSRRVIAKVVGHRMSWENSARSYAPVYRFDDEAGQHEVVDSLHSSFAKPEVGTLVELVYPERYPHLARPPRRLMWLVVYLLLAFLLAILIGKTMGWLPESGGDIPG